MVTELEEGQGRVWGFVYLVVDLIWFEEVSEWGGYVVFIGLRLLVR